MGLYKGSLVVLQKCDSNIQTIRALAPFLSSVMFRKGIPPYIGPKAFNDFWVHTYHDKVEYVSHYPEEIREALRTYDLATGTKLSLHIPDSQEETVYLVTLPVSLD
jgi:hypothetical protein